MARRKRRSALRKNSAVAREYRQIVSGQQELRFDYARRLRNALFALSLNDSCWREWIRREVPKGISTEEAMRIVERHTKILVTARYSWVIKSSRWNIVYGDAPFGDDGSLVLG